jgi:hypothetical protein
MILIGETSLRRVVNEIPIEGEIECDSRLGGMLNYYYGKAA